MLQCVLKHVVVSFYEQYACHRVRCSVCVVVCVTVCVAACALEHVHSSCVCVFKCGRGSGCCSTRAVYVLRCVLHSVPHTMLQRVE